MEISQSTTTVLYRNDNFIAVNKPSGILVHRTNIAEPCTEYLLQIVRDKLNRKLYPVHRLDRPTSGVILFGLDAAAAKKLNSMLTSGEITKKYTALVRGWFPDSYLLEYPVKNDRGKKQEAITEFQCQKRLILNHPVGNFPTARYSIISCTPHTGRWHQIRQHLAHMRHYIINDRVHGDGKHNRIFKYDLGIEQMFLHATSLIMENIEITAPFPFHWNSLLCRDDITITG